MVECTRCGCRNDIESRFCAACGFSMLPQLVQRVATPAPAFMAQPAPWAQLAPGFPAAAAPMPRPEPEWAAAQRRPGYGSDAWNLPRPAPDHTVPQSSQPMVSPSVEGGPRRVTPTFRHTDPSISAAPILMGFLVSFDGNDLGRFWPLHQGQLLVGRAQTSENLDIAIEHNTTSARHAQLIALARPSRVSVQDLGSTNGTFLNDQRLTPGQPLLAAHGDRLRFGGYNVHVVLIA
jgi:hypothetical protein